MISYKPYDIRIYLQRISDLISRVRLVISLVVLDTDANTYIVTHITDIGFWKCYTSAFHYYVSNGRDTMSYCRCIGLYCIDIISRVFDLLYCSIEFCIIEISLDCTQSEYCKLFHFVLFVIMKFSLMRDYLLLDKLYPGKSFVKFYC